ncbi:rhomboid family intramembrane serine protease [Aquibacillus koreensis]|uniref:Rhomboid family intramembrane serine protease n=1 Tax=Aquibacillus koreensis TaxID=279446 RepID=A0A9X4AGJ4_9BACI|nr:rhomboid family intramembrane serine protease [Aquibacillus koreensis]MCT2537560.1 rhomboid family intramembrane serine protease [Aquibacillus koreensis]MDC3419006.1 rhomboid family intramembrane serine protease [Aquibacillus koreensis]
MFIKEVYLFYRISYQLVHDHKWEIVVMNNNNEIWLEKKVKGKTHVIRMIQRSFDWKNHMQNDINATLNKTNKIKRFLMGRNIELHNVYIATYPPVDDWEFLKKPRALSENKLKKLSVYYLDQTDWQKEISRLYSAVGMDYSGIDYPTSEIELEQITQYLKSMLIGKYQDQIKETKNLFQNGKPKITYVLLGINLFLFMLLEMSGGSTNIEALINLGAKYNPAIIEGEWWRIISSMFLHIGVLHLFMNMLALFYVGALVEQIYGNVRFTIIYFLAGIIGGLSSFAFNSQVAAGASGALFGLFGALLFFGLNYRRVFFQTMGWNVIFVILLNIMFGLSIPAIDNGAHLGGLLGGFVASSIVFFPSRQKKIIQLFAIIVYASLAIGLVVLGLSNATV